MINGRRREERGWRKRKRESARERERQKDRKKLLKECSMFPGTDRVILAFSAGGGGGILKIFDGCF
jgi:hypothetical protein